MKPAYSISFLLSISLYGKTFFTFRTTLVGYLVIESTNICYKKIALQLEVSMGKFAAGPYGTGLSFCLVCGFNVGGKYRLRMLWILQH